MPKTSGGGSPQLTRGSGKHRQLLQRYLAQPLPKLKFVISECQRSHHDDLVACILLNFLPCYCRDREAMELWELRAHGEKMF